jgi:uncharacterized protein (TIGR02246 family)
MIGGLALALAAGAAAQAQDVRASIEAANKTFEAAAAKGDGAALAALYTSDGRLLPANSDFVIGTAAIQKFWQGALDSGIRGAILTTVEAEGHGTVAHEVGTYELRDQAGKPLDKGKYVVIWKKVGTQWKLHRDIWTTSMPPAKP